MLLSRAQEQNSQTRLTFDKPNTKIDKFSHNVSRPPVHKIKTPKRSNTNPHYPPHGEILPYIKEVSEKEVVIKADYIPSGKIHNEFRSQSNTITNKSQIRENYQNDKIDNSHRQYQTDNHLRNQVNNDNSRKFSSHNIKIVNEQLEGVLLAPNIYQCIERGAYQSHNEKSVGTLPHIDEPYKDKSRRSFRSRSTKSLYNESVSSRNNKTKYIDTKSNLSINLPSPEETYLYLADVIGNLCQYK